MALFGFGKKKEEKKAHDHTAAKAKTGGEKTDGIRCVKVLGAGCKSCHEQYENAKKAAAALGLPLTVEYITDMQKAMEYGVMRMPAIVVNEKVASQGKVLKAAQVESLLRGFMA